MAVSSDLSNWGRREREKVMNGGGDRTAEPLSIKADNFELGKPMTWYKAAFSVQVVFQYFCLVKDFLCLIYGCEKIVLVSLNFGEGIIFVIPKVWEGTLLFQHSISVIFPDSGIWGLLFTGTAIFTPHGTTKDPPRLKGIRQRSSIL